jgi:hypothetical protein
MYQMRPKVAMIDVGIAIAAMIVERSCRGRAARRARRESSRRRGALRRCDRRLDELREVADDADVVAGGSAA